MKPLNPTDPRPGVEYVAVYDRARHDLTYWRTRTDCVTAKGVATYGDAGDMLRRLEREGFAVRGQTVVEA